jgi:fatty-acyl-CoA synthase
MKGLILAGIETTDSAVMTRPEKAAGSLRPLPTHDALPRRFSDFATMGEALDYAASGTRGFNFHDARGNLARPYPYSELRADALACAYRLIAHGIKPEDRIALIAETGVEFAQMFFGVIYAGAWPVPLPLPTSFGGKESYIDQISVQLSSCDPKILFFPAELAEMAGEAARLNKVEGLAWRISSRVKPSPAAAAGAYRRDLLSSVQQRLDALPAWRRGDAQGAAVEPFRP